MNLQLCPNLQDFQVWSTSGPKHCLYKGRWVSVWVLNMYLLIALSLTHTTEVKPLPAEVFNQCHKIPALRKRSTRSSLERPLLPVCYPLNKEAQLAALMGFSQSISAGCCKCSSLGEHPILSIRHLLLFFFYFCLLQT